MDRLKLLMDYTKFHIGVYLTLGSLCVGLMRLELLSASEVLPGIILLFVAGAAGGVIASNIPEYSNWKSFYKAELKVFCFKFLEYKYLSTIEHLSFWSAIIITVFLVLSDIGCKEEIFVYV